MPLVCWRCWFVLELQTGGNIRLEEGKPGEMWYKSCMDLVRSRFYTADFLALGLKDIKVVKVCVLPKTFESLVGCRNKCICKWKVKPLHFFWAFWKHI